MGTAVCVVLAGGYAEDVRDSVDISFATFEAVAARSVAGFALTPGHLTVSVTLS